MRCEETKYNMRVTLNSIQGRTRNGKTNPDEMLNRVQHDETHCQSELVEDILQIK